MSRAESMVTSVMHLPGNLFSASVLLRDNAEPVEVRDRCSDPLAVVTYIGRDGRGWATFVCCGPSATVPRN